MTQQQFNIDNSCKQHAWLIVPAHLAVEHLLKNEPASNMAHTSGGRCQLYMSNATQRTSRRLLQQRGNPACSELIMSQVLALQDSAKVMHAFDWQCFLPVHARLAAILWQSVNLVVGLQWGHSMLADLDL